MRRAITLLFSLTLTLTVAGTVSAQDEPGASDDRIDPAALEAMRSTILEAQTEADALIAALAEAQSSPGQPLILPDGRLVQLSDDELRVVVAIVRTMDDRGDVALEAYIPMVDALLRARR